VDDCNYLDNIKKDVVLGGGGGGGGVVGTSAMKKGV